MTIYKLTDLNGNSKSLYKPNLLINGDFKINIRNQTTYSADTIWTYTLPMWRINNGKLYVNKGFVRFHRETSINNAYLNQVVATKSDSICVVKVKEISGNAVIRFGDSTVTKPVSNSGIYIVYNPQPISAVAIELPNQNSYINIEYIDLFDGDIAYSHVEEDDAIAQMRCRRYVLPIYMSLLVRANKINSFETYFDTFNEFEDTPSIDKSYLNEEGVLYMVSNALYIDKDDLQISVTKNGNLSLSCSVSSTSLTVNDIGTLTFNGYVIATCEP